MICAKCGSSLPENANYCPHCGIRLKESNEASILTKTSTGQRHVFEVGALFMKKRLVIDTSQNVVEYKNALTDPNDYRRISGSKPITVVLDAYPSNNRELIYIKFDDLEVPEICIDLGRDNVNKVILIFARLFNEGVSLGGNSGGVRISVCEARGDFSTVTAAEGPFRP